MKIMPDNGGPTGEHRRVTDLRPVPDPTELTTKQLHREIEQLAEKFEAQVASMHEVAHERFLRLDHQFTLTEAQRIEQKADTRLAVDAALAAQKEAVKEQTLASDKAIAKSETSFTVQLQQLTATFQTEVGGLRRDIDDLKTRTTTVEQQKIGAIGDRSGLYAGAGFLLVLFSIGAIVISLVK